MPDPDFETLRSIIDNVLKLKGTECVFRETT